MSPFLKLNLVCILKLFRGKKSSLKCNMLALKTEPFPACLHSGQCHSLAGARRAEGTLCRIRHSIGPAVPLSRTSQEPSWVAAPCHRPGPSRPALHEGQGQPGAAPSVLAGEEACDSQLQGSWWWDLCKVLVTMAILSSFWFLEVGGVCFVPKLNLNFPTDLHRGHVLPLHIIPMMQYLIRTQKRGKGRGKRKEETVRTHSVTASVHRGEQLGGKPHLRNQDGFSS